LNKYYFTFGYGQTPGIGYYHIIEAENEGVARERMHERFGPKWAFCYYSAEAAGVERFNLKLVP
jgi:hypothetical protein